MKIQLLSMRAAPLAALSLLATPALAQEPTTADLVARLDKLERENADLKRRVDELSGGSPVATRQIAPEPAPSSSNVLDSEADQASGRFVGVSPEYGFQVLDHAENTNTKPILQLEARRSGDLRDMVTLSGQITVLADYQWSNRPSKFGYLMRNPTSANQIGDSVSEAVIHSGSLAATVAMGSDFTGYIEMFYGPEQSFGAGTITNLARNQVQVRRAYLLWGNLDKSPVYAAIGKLDTPFGLNDTVSPFTNSTVWHAFEGLAYGAQLGYFKDGLSVRAMAIQGGAQFRGANTPVDGTNVPSRLNNYAIDARYTLELNRDFDVMVGGSYERGSAYCQAYPVVHFNPCSSPNPAWAAYGKVNVGPVTLLGEYAQTTKVWPGSAVPDPLNPLSQYAAQKTKAYTLGGRYNFGSLLENGAVDQAVSFEFSTFIAGDDGAPWERQNQWVLGYSRSLTPSLNLFGEYVKVEGFAPLNFVSGGNFPDGSTWSDRGATTDVLLVGVQAAF